MRKLIHSRFELDLSPFKISDTEENNWFSDSFFTKYSFPFNIDLTEDIDIAFGFISQYNAQNVETYFDCKYIHNNKIEDAVLEVESHQDKLSCILRFGFEQLPSFDKMLSELSLDKFDLPAGTSIYQHAETIISKTWPEVNYNFPQIHVDKYDPNDDLWNGFESIINNRVDGAFLTNTVDTVADITYNRNVIQPLPYWIHILQRGMIDGGYLLSGKILIDPRLQKACLFADADYFKKPTFQEPITIFQQSEDAIPFNNNVKYLSKTTLTVPGKYNISGTILAQARSSIGGYFTIKYRNSVLFSVKAKGTDFWTASRFENYDVDVDFETIVDLNVNEITIETYQPKTTDRIVIDLNISCIRLHDATGVAIPTISNENKVDLTKAVPAINFVDFIKVVKNWFNYDLTIVGKLAVMNPIEDEINHHEAEDLQFTEVKKPLRKFSQGTSFLLKFSDIENKDFKFPPVFHSRESILNSNYITNDKTIPIEINALPLPLFTRNGRQTAYAIESNDSKVFLVPYDGLYNGNNLAKPIDEYQLPAVHLQYWKKWFDFRINSHAFVWGFKACNEQIINLKAKMKIFAYNKYHIVRNINKTEIEPDLFEVEIEAESLE
ncbi:hypothetical protein ACMDB5_13260 [Flavobacterium sp. W1B]|uniref:hypothetical protein n=1 Tax=Flavobacterium sp. W1B TaxID=3394146 RepID=UPI0039BD5FA6